MRDEPRTARLSRQESTEEEPDRLFRQPANPDVSTIGVPFGRPINPVTKGDWEGKGVEPDVKVSAADALSTAEKLAADKLATQSKPR